MKPPAFDYYEPENLPEALALLAQQGERASVLAGGQSLIPALNMRLARPAALVDINRLTELDFIRQEGETLVIGALTRHYQLEESGLIQRVCPLLAEAAAAIGYPAIRTRGTIGGSLAYADPAGELPLILACLGGSVSLVSSVGRRVVAAADWLRAPFKTAIAPGELLIEARIPQPPPHAGWALVELNRGVGRTAQVDVACLVELDGGDHIASARLAVGGAGASSRRLPGVEKQLIGQRATEANFASVAQQMAEVISLGGDVHASADFRRKLATTATQRALALATERARTVAQGA
ncbi:MAG TPA: xanthine dehydrogenase family protein subunit M [Ktedonobacterales bacterium]|nr:xanthine dehydrogenase family protein subunit M [Ktedonobacterales bacterium]